MSSFIRKGLIFMALIIMTASIMIAASCSSDKETEKEPAVKAGQPEIQKPVIVDANLEMKGYEGWKEYSDEFLTAYAPPDSALLERVPAIAQRIKQVFAENAYRLKVQIPMPITFYLYNNTNEIEELAGCPSVCVQGNTVHYMIYAHLGIPVMTILLDRFDPDGTPYFYLYEGLITLLDYSGTNYVEEAYMDYFNDEAVPLDSMINNQAYMALDSARRTHASASFIQFLIDKPWSPDSVLSLYRHTDPPKKALEEIFGRPVAQLQKDWYEYLKINSGLDVEQDYGR